jgi:UDP-GlcNAc:undecaprenyl-phosphate/decaprenyl-phosphate GlcNAc-1-phosphate transferase
MDIRFIYFLVFVLLALTINYYFVLAKKVGITDKPNSRSSHSDVTIRGGGIVFYFAPLLYLFFIEFGFLQFFIGLTIISAISFMDDVKPLPRLIRLVLQLIAVGFLFSEMKIFHFQWFALAAILVLVLGTINAYNFMDGINGMTALYSSVLFVSFWVTNQQEHFFEPGFLFFILIALIVFSFYNVRIKAVCFAGDVGSVSMAYIVLFVLLTLIFGNDPFKYKYILFLSLYGVDTVLTIVHRLFLRENIFQPHRKHLYQYMANEAKLPHVLVSILYAGAQACINAWVFFTEISWQQAVVLFLVLGIIYIGLKWRIIKHGGLQPKLGSKRKRHRHS